MPTWFEWAIAVILPVSITWLAIINASPESYFAHFWIYMFTDVTWGHLFHLLLLVPARLIAAHLPGSKVPPLDDEGKLVEQEEQSNDPSIVWPSPEVVATLPQDWAYKESNTNETSSSSINSSPSKRMHRRKIKNESLHCNNKRETPSTAVSYQNPAVQSKTKNSNQPDRQPYYLNHVRGSTRIRQVSQRIAAAMGTIFSTYLLCSYSSLVTLEGIGLGIRSSQRVLSDLAIGFAVGSFLVAFMFVLEVRMGWIRIIGFRETVVTAESFAMNFSLDVLFHVGVSVNEEVMLRGWMFIMGVHGLLLSGSQWFNNPSIAANVAICTSIVLQSTLFSLLHLYSPGSTTISLLNLFLGGIAASLNVIVTGGSLWLGIGWHFGWNIVMGHVLGRSTSGIPMSCALVSVIPRPVSAKTSYEKFHGGTFGPEQGVLAPLAYSLGILMVVWIYGWEEAGDWREQLMMKL